ncbi:MAG TPA: hypothetical protein PLW99_02790 [Candidatus Paceibacterota bacterium]|nr:hypothetical protein [Candidatus Paceibacterota bacterium]
MNLTISTIAVAVLALAAGGSAALGEMKVMTWVAVALYGCYIVAAVGVAAFFTAFYLATCKRPVAERAVTSGVLHYLGLGYFCLGMSTTFILRNYIIEEAVVLCAVFVVMAIVFSWFAVCESRLAKGSGRTIKGIATVFPFLGLVFGFVTGH